ncbi:carbamoyltransferase C-terminal domain-containing protein [uncultured Tateyamaria sp.]|uniref:carbamoyltransferase family protein n=1 Tax=uncultured Tateyamaria sp. TaxID=455651 RepID=UPI00261CC914|nr:carbamoyltransferase C-terminal domain-containing protein [uncultured Tateyamaria sp.]
MLIIGLNTSGYVSSAAVVVDGELVFAAAEERFDRSKYSKYFPMHSMQAGLKHIGADIDDVDCFAVGYNPAISVAGRPRAGFSEWPGYPGYRFSSNPNNLLPFLTPAEWRETQQIFVAGDGEKTRLRYITHHLAHAANAFLLSGESTAAIFTCDGYGERAALTLGHADSSGIHLSKQIDFPHSIGMFYATMTQFLGFVPHGDEWKLMGAAAYGDPARYLENLGRTLAWTSDGELEVDLSYFNYFDFDVAPMYRPKLERLLGPPRRPEEPIEQRHYDLAAAVQRLTEDYMRTALESLHRATGTPVACLSGGVMMNSVFNGKAALDGPFERIFVPFAPDDNGNSIGAALWVAWQEGELRPGDRPSGSPCLGPNYTDEEIRTTLERFNLEFEFCADIAERTAQLISAGRVVGWFQGRMEFGDRALGNRSILADPRDPAMKERLNRAVKYREAFRPFAPSILATRQRDFVAAGEVVVSPYMDKALPILPALRQRVPAVVHADGTARVQTVQAEYHPLFHSMIEAFEKITGVPIVLNTSFNVAGEPIVESPSDAIRTFFTSGLDALAIGSFLLCKSSCTT